MFFVAKNGLKTRIWGVSAIRRTNEQKKQEAQGIAEAVQMASVQVGKILNAMPKATKNNNLSGLKKSSTQIEHEVDLGSKPKMQAVQEMGLTQKQAEQFQQMAANEDTVKEAIQKARSNDDVVSRAFIMGEIKKAKRKEAISRQVADIEQGHIEHPSGAFSNVATSQHLNISALRDFQTFHR